jgi:DNA repair photolyase
MRGPRPPIHGRGAAENPPNRFEKLVYADERDAIEADEPRPATELLRDSSRSILARNESPDVGFEFSINPYRGCEHGCVYCLGADTPILHADMTWRPIGQARVGDELVGFDEFPQPGGARKLRRAVIRVVRYSRAPTIRLVTLRSEVYTTANHGWLQDGKFRWSCAHQLTRGRRLRYATVTTTPLFDDDYRLGYIAGVALGDGTFRDGAGWRSDKLGSYWRIAMADAEPLLRLVEYLRCFGVDVPIRPFHGGPWCRKPMQEVETRALGKLAILLELLRAERDSASYRRGFLAGFFDAEGHSGDALRISQLDHAPLSRCIRYASALGFRLELAPRPGVASSLRLMASLMERIRFFSTCRPAIARKTEAVFDREMNLAPESIEAVEPGPVRDVVDITTSTGTFLAAGLATHNCFARPTHETLGFSSGLDFETKILVKENAPELLRAELCHPKWKPQAIAVSGVTDAYQPIERKLRITRRCIEVLAEFRNPTMIVTKNQLVVRDADLLAALASDRAAAVFVSVTSLDAGLQQKMEPRASPPQRRLDAIRALSQAGVPVGVLVAPVVLGLTDHEMPAILAAAAEAGAQSAGYVPLRLPYAVKEIFDRWLDDHFPDRKEKILHRIRSIRGGRLNDPNFGSRLRGEGIFAEEIRTLFTIAARRAGLLDRRIELSSDAFRRPGARQLTFLL